VPRRFSHAGPSSHGYNLGMSDHWRRPCRTDCCNLPCAVPKTRSGCRCWKQQGRGHSRERAIAEWLVRYCPVCDGYEALDKNIAVVGPLEHAAKEAAFLRTYSASVSVLPVGDCAGQGSQLRQPGIKLISSLPQDFQKPASGIAVKLQNRGLPGLRCALPRARVQSAL
jgi:hypothetical protein